VADKRSQQARRGGRPAAKAAGTGRDASSGGKPAKGYSPTAKGNPRPACQRAVSLHIKPGQAGHARASHPFPNRGQQGGLITRGGNRAAGQATSQRHTAASTGPGRERPQRRLAPGERATDPGDRRRGRLPVDRHRAQCRGRGRETRTLWRFAGDPARSPGALAARAPGCRLGEGGRAVYRRHRRGRHRPLGVSQCAPGRNLADAASGRRFLWPADLVPPCRRVSRADRALALDGGENHGRPSGL
jgi:hypothetical protein